MVVQTEIAALFATASAVCGLLLGLYLENLHCKQRVARAERRVAESDRRAADAESAQSTPCKSCGKLGVTATAKHCPNCGIKTLREKVERLYLTRGPTVADATGKKMWVYYLQVSRSYPDEDFSSVAEFSDPELCSGESLVKVQETYERDHLGKYKTKWEDIPLVKTA